MEITPRATVCVTCRNRANAARRRITDLQGYIRSRTTLNGECWFWSGSTDRQGYGRCGRGLGERLAHRLSYRAFKGDIDPALEVSHLCGRASCCNPDHLTTESHSLNMRRAAHIAAQVERTHCVHGHPFSGPNLRMYRGKRTCRACAAANRDRNRARKRADHAGTN